MNALHHETELNAFVNKFVARLLQSAASDLASTRAPNAHEVAMAYQAAFNTRAAAI